MNKEVKNITEVNEKSQKKKTPKWVILLIVLGALYYLVPMGLFAFVIITEDFKTEYKVLDDGKIEIDKGKLTIQKEVRGYYDEEKKVYYIEGKLTNNTDKDYNGVAINYNVYNENGEVLGEASSYLQKLGANKTWNFKVVYDEIDADSVSKFEYNPGY